VFLSNQDPASYPTAGWPEGVYGQACVSRASRWS